MVRALWHQVATFSEYSPCPLLPHGGSFYIMGKMGVEKSISSDFMSWKQVVSPTSNVSGPNLLFWFWSYSCIWASHHFEADEFYSIVCPVKVYWHESKEVMTNSWKKLHTQVGGFPKRQVGLQRGRRLEYKQNPPQHQLYVNILHWILGRDQTGLPTKRDG